MNPYAEVEAALIDWHSRLEARERDLNALQAHLVQWMQAMTTMARVLGEMVDRQVPVVRERVPLRLVPPADAEDRR